MSVFCYHRNTRHWRKIDFAGLLFVVFMMSPAEAQAEGGDVRLILSEQGVWDSNPMMLTQNVKEIYGETTMPRVLFFDKTETSKIGFDAWLENSVFNRSEYNATDYHAQLDFTKQTQRLHFGVQGKLDYDSTRTSEISNFGQATLLSRHLGYAASPTIGYDLSQLSKVELTGSYDRSIYDKATYVDYRTVSFSPAYTRKLTELYSGIILANLRRYQTEEGMDKIVDSVGPMIGFSAVFTPKLSGQLRVGAEASREKGAGLVTQDWMWSSVFSSNMTYTGDQDTFRLLASRAQQSYGNGNNALLTSFGVQEEKQMTPKVTLRVGLTYQFSDKDKSSAANLDAQYIGDAGLTYHVVEKLDVTTSYYYRNESYVHRAQTAQKSIARVGLVYRPTIEGIL